MKIKVLKYIIFLSATLLITLSCSEGNATDHTVYGMGNDTNVVIRTDNELGGENVETDTLQTAPNEDKNESIPTGARRLLDAYPKAITEFKDNKLVFADGTTLVYDDGKKKDFVTMLDNSDPEDMFSIPYNKGGGTPGYLEDCGRSRSDALFKKLYGATSAQVQKQMVSVPWFGGNIRFSGSHGAAEQLRKVKAELDRKPHLQQFVKGAQTFNWRPVRGAKRMSAHSYGIAVDVGVSKSNYWQWDNRGANELKKIGYKNRIPMELVEIFEHHGFIWGGRWYHYDTMHFEYRPELNPPK